MATRDVDISFVIPAHNEADYLGLCLQSVSAEAKASSRSVEIIVVDNASTDATAQVAGSFPGVKVVYEAVKGLTAARQAGFAVSHGALIANIDADTRLPAGWLATVFATFERNKKLAALSGPFIYYDLTPFDRALVRFFYGFAWLLHIIAQHVLHLGAMMQGGNFIVRREALHAIGGFNLAFHFYGEDTELARRLTAVGQVKFSFGLPMYTSGRRLKEEGIATMGIRYALNFLWTIVFRRPFTHEYRDIRKAK